MAQKSRKEYIGEVVSDKMDKTVAVMVESLYQHPQYGKVVKRRKKFMAHDEERKCRVGDKVKIIETRPLSKTKNWKVIEVLESIHAGEAENR
ncbi:MAG TPA: 30S ribosomal protein S17 [Nitrospiraceae bacterium]|uniref:Small ribosomal subunit protein uS17 n=1 Tax=uncultured Nitrospirae bacterium Rifle_16ft_4_minimus_4901 TaxID=1665132 RepID=A0A0H4TBP9_9BACT|nr:30S ribosomal protein S17, small subunit ribosomal protein S17 [uncultured Nitrospirae bacterium Rifle_16ft_4_minimus_4901]OGW15894.1 MAG: 30S ribosomal protein S17 [Nitrospirae bacterium GWA2_42_11]HAS17112.1 30S ribosomal protein S17 [Nitrospiraceae bacterium]HBI24668.1 30S ribosomal protein S17 [Nitrospiraceae bacterium]